MPRRTPFCSPHRRPAHHLARGITFLEVIVVIFAIVILIGIMLPALGKQTHHAPQLKDSTQVRGIQQAMVIWANTNGAYPLPSNFDKDNATVNAYAESKNTTGNILSMMIFNSSISPEICVSPSEVSDVIGAKLDYQYSQPTGAADPLHALWDPTFRGTPVDNDRAALGHQSYAHLIPVGNRRFKLWTDTFSSTQAIIGNRGPAYAESDCAPGLAKGVWTPIAGRLGRESKTLRIHGGRTTWEGNIAYNDNHVSFETKAAPDAVTYTRSALAGGGPLLDNLFLNEADERDGGEDVTKGLNAYLRPISKIDRERVSVWRD